MKMIAHRGWWKTPEEKNSIEAFRRAIAGGYGIETDFRDLAGALVVAHDPPIAGAMLAEALLRLGIGRGHLTLALNVKADGLQEMIAAALREKEISDYFLFDMSAPDALVSHHAGLRFFTRESEIEPSPYLYEAAAGVWIDQFYSDWVDNATIRKHLDGGKEVCLVSPELHRRDPRRFWERLRASGEMCRAGIMLCTDFPDEAERFFA